MNNKYLFALIISVLTVTIRAQETVYHISQNQDYNKGIDYFNKGNYATAKEFFLNVVNKHQDDDNSEVIARSAYYASMCAVKLFHDDSEYLVIRFINQYPGHTMVNYAYFELANYFYAVKKYGNSLEYYKKVDTQKLTSEDKSEFYFKLGYCYFMKEDLENARVAFYEIKDLNTKYTSPALYYYSHINYSQKNYQTALDGFIKLNNDPTFGSIIPYYVTQIYFLQEKYDKVIAYAPQYLDSVVEKRVAEVARMTGESFFRTGRFKESIPYLEKYMEKADFVTQEDKYQLAYAYYKSEQYENAADMFARLSSGNSLICQNALYHLADCYLKLDRKQDARMAFVSASKLDFDKNIKEDALFNYAVVTYELAYNPFNEALIALNDYIVKYPDSKRTDEAYGYLVMAYMNTKNYSMALASLEKIKNKTPEIKKSYQRIAYYRALELFNNQKYTDAVNMLEKSFSYGVSDNQLRLLSDFWKAEAYYRMGDFTNAIDNYKLFLDKPSAYQLNEYELGLYGIGYSYFKQKQYADAETWFRKYITSMNNAKVNTVADALNRTGDCFFIRQNYHSAVDFYERSIQNGTFDSDYALFQKSLSLGVLGKENEKIENLNKLITNYKNSNYLDDALYELGEGYVSLTRTDEALKAYDKIVNDFPESSYVPKALVQLGLLNYNSNRLTGAMDVYKKVVRDYPGTDEAQVALSGIKNVYVEQNNVEGYFAYAKNLGSFAQVSEREQDSLSYISAENIYMSGDCEKSLPVMKRYIDNHSTGSFVLNAHFYKGDCEYQLKKYDDAFESFEFVISKPKNVFTEQALLGASRIAFSQKQYDKAVNYYKKLESITETHNNKVEAKTGIMRSYYLLGDYDKTVDASRAVLAAEKVSDVVIREARFKLAKSLYAKDRMALALEEFLVLSKEVTSPEGAESKYRVAEIYFKQNQHDNATKVINEFAEKTTPHQYWMAMSFILWADIFAAKGDNFQATQTLQSIIDYYENTSDGILDQAKEKHKKLVEKQQSDEKVVEPKDLEININD